MRVCKMLHAALPELLVGATLRAPASLICLPGGFILDLGSSPADFSIGHLFPEAGDYECKNCEHWLG